MAARLSPKHDAMTRDKIKTSQLINRLQGFVFNDPDPKTGKPQFMSRDQASVAVALLRKTMPDLAVMQLTGDADKPIVTRNEYAWADATPVLKPT